MAKARVPHVALVLLPALLLAAVGVRAVTAEMRASEDAARERARSVASRLARSVDALVAEYAGALPKPGTALTREQARDVTTYLQGPRALTTNGASLGLYVGRFGEGPIEPDEKRLLEDAMSTARRIADAPGGASAAATLLLATRNAVKSQRANAELYLTAADYDPAVLDSADGVRLQWTGIVVRGTRASDGTPLDALALRVATKDARRASAAVAASDADDTTPRLFDYWPSVFARNHLESGQGPEWAWRSAYAAVAEDVYGMADEERARLLDAFERAAGSALSKRDRDGRRAWDASRALAQSLASAGAPSVTTLDVGGYTISVWTDVSIDGTRALLGGDIPAAILQDRIGPVAAALVGETDGGAVRLITPRGVGLFEMRHPTAPVSVAVEIAHLAEPLSAWRAEAVVARESGIPPTAWLLGAAVLVTTAALVGGTLALRRSAERSARLAEDRQTFLDHVAHELRTPAAAVQALTEELASGHVTKEREAAYREHLLRESRRLSALVEDTLDLTRLDAGRLAFKMEPADLRDVVRRAVEESDGAGRVIATLPDAPIVRAVDEATLRRAVKNLVENAIRHGGSEAPVRVTLEASNGAASITVADEGRGIAKEHLPRLFERFYRVPSATHETKGVGLGLALCREVARAHGGDVGVTSEVDEGSTFTIRIPLA